MNQLDEITDEAHDRKADGHRATNVKEFLLVRLGTSVHKLASLLEEFLGDFAEFLDLVHGGGGGGGCWLELGLFVEWVPRFEVCVTRYKHFC